MACRVGGEILHALAFGPTNREREPDYDPLPYRSYHLANIPAKGNESASEILLSDKLDMPPVVSRLNGTRYPVYFQPLTTLTHA
jgi:hypothetical protein